MVLYIGIYIESDWLYHAEWVALSNGQSGSELAEYSVDKVSTTVTYLLLLLSSCGVVFLVVASIKNNKFEGYVRSTCFLVIMANLYLWIKPW